MADGSQDIPVTGPPAVWEANVYFLYPTSEEYGPLPNPDSSLWGCFQHSPTGALFAAANAFSGLLSGDRQAFVMEGALENGREAWLEAFADSPEGQSAGRVAQISAFQFQSVEDDRVVVALGLVQDEVTGVISVALEYVDGNWLVDLPSSAFRPVGSDLAGYTPWSAE